MIIKWFKKMVLIFIVFMIIISSFMFFPRLFQKDGIESKDPFLETLIFPKDFNKRPLSGDILLWANTSIDSLVIQQLTDGLYSHCGILRKDSQDYTWVLDTYPKQGLRYMSLYDYLHPKDLQLTRVCLIRFKGKLNTNLVEKYIDTFLKNHDRIIFDRSVIFDPQTLDLSHLQLQTQSIYCAELIALILRDATLNAKIYENDYDRVMVRWDILAQNARSKKLSPLDFIKLFYMKLNLNKLKESSQKTLISPNGILRSGSFNIISEVTGLAEPSYIKKYLTEVPQIPSSQTHSNSQKQD